MKKIIEFIKLYHQKLKWKMLAFELVDKFFNDKDVQYFFQNRTLTAQEKTDFIENNKDGLLSLINYEKNSSSKNWHAIMPFCFKSRKEDSKNIMHFSESKPTAILYYALKFNILEASHYEADHPSYYTKKDNLFTLQNLELIRYTALSILIEGSLTHLSYMIENKKFNLNLFNSDILLNQTMVQALKLNDDDKKIFFQKVLDELKEKDINLERISSFNTYSDVHKLYNEYKNYLIEKEANHIDQILSLNNEPHSKKKQKI